MVMVGLFATTGCTQSILGVMLAPEAVVGGVAGGLAQAGAETLSGASLEELSDLSSTVQEIDQLLKDNPNAVNADRLREMQKSLQENSMTSTGADQRRIAHAPAPPRRASDAPLPRRKGDRLTVSPPGDLAMQRRPASRPDTLPTGSALREDPTPVHVMSLQPVRVR
jgi:hypothetical protein